VGRLADALNAMLERLEQAFRDREASERQLREFLSDASHELRTPLTTIRAHAEMYRNPAFSPDDATTYAARIETETVRMGRLIDDLLLLARLDQGTELQAEEVDIVTLVEQAVDAARIVDPRHAITIDVPTDPVLVMGDGHRLRQAIDNLLTNVRVHGGPDATATVRIERRGGDAVVSVLDDGPGVDAADVDRLADRFFRSHPARQQGRPGTGLGLSIVSAVVAGHDGSIELTSNGDGFTATLRLPLTNIPALEPQPVA
jgi:two-component system OmpR family sensor kinase